MPFGELFGVSALRGFIGKAARFDTGLEVDSGPGTKIAVRRT
jgi:hypothetical protein